MVGDADAKIAFGMARHLQALVSQPGRVIAHRGEFSIVMLPIGGVCALHINGADCAIAARVDVFGSQIELYGS